MSVRVAAATLGLSILLGACGDGRPGGVAAGRSSVSLQSSTTVARGSQRSVEVFGGLSVTVTLDSEEVVAGEVLRSSLAYENLTESVLTVEDCELAEAASAIVAPGDPDPELSLEPLVDCRGDQAIEPGESDAFDGPLFPARTQHGSPVQPGDYEAVFELDGRIQRLPVTIVADVGDSAHVGSYEVSGRLQLVGGPTNGTFEANGQVSAVDGNGDLVATTATDGDGRFVLRLQPGIYEIVGRSPQYRAGGAACHADSDLNVVENPVGDVRVNLAMR